MGGGPSTQELKDQIDRMEREQQREREREQKRERERKQEREAQEKRQNERRQQEEINKKRVEVLRLRFGSTQGPFSNRTYPKDLYVGLFGIAGVGKSSLLNSLIYSTMGCSSDLTRVQIAPQSYQLGGHTMTRMKTKITDYIFVVDNRGFNVGDMSTPLTVKDVLISQLEGKGSYREKVIWNQHVNFDDKVSEMIYCSVFVFDARSELSVLQPFNHLITAVREWQGHYPIAVLTHVDIASSSEKRNVRTFLGSIGVEDIYEVANCTDHSSPLPQMYQINMLKFIERCVYIADNVYRWRNYED